LFYTFWVFIAVAAGPLLIFLPHSLLWGIRELLTENRTEGTDWIRRFTPVQRLFHLLLILSFLSQATTGLGRMYVETEWGQFLTSLFGGYQETLQLHTWGALAMLLLFGVYLVYALGCINWKQFPSNLFDPDTIFPRRKDLRQFLQHFGWFLGLSKHPRFEKWGYWEKFDYWAVFWGMAVLGVTGLLLLNGETASRYISGRCLNAALWVHRIEATLAVCHVFIIHFFIVHFRRRSFPMDLAMFDGRADLDIILEERPAWGERISEAGGKMIGAETGLGRRIVFYLFGAAAVGCGIFLILGALINIGRITL